MRADRAELIGHYAFPLDGFQLRAASNLWASAGSSVESGYLRAARIPELRAGWDGVLARFEPSVRIIPSDSALRGGVHSRARGNFIG